MKLYIKWTRVSVIKVFNKIFSKEVIEIMSDKDVKQEEVSPKSIDEYISMYTGPGLVHMNRMREIVKETAPELKEKISWGMPTFYLNKNICHFAHNKKHLGFYPGGEAVEHFSPELGDFVFSKGTIQFPYDKELPVELIKRIVLYNIEKDKTPSKK